MHEFSSIKETPTLSCTTNSLTHLLTIFQNYRVIYKIVGISWGNGRQQFRQSSFTTVSAIYPLCFNYAFTEKDRNNLTSYIPLKRSHFAYIYMLNSFLILPCMQSVEDWLRACTFCYISYTF